MQAAPSEARAQTQQHLPDTAPAQLPAQTRPQTAEATTAVPAPSRADEQLAAPRESPQPWLNPAWAAAGPAILSAEQAQVGQQALQVLGQEPGTVGFEVYCRCNCSR